MSRDDKLAVVSSYPVIFAEGSIASDILRLMWYSHNEVLARMSREGANNHSCDEMMVIKPCYLSKLPAGTINDGAYLAGLAIIKGYRVSYSPDAKVMIDVPKRLADVLGQRRRIIFGHLQVWKLLGKAPKTMESLVVMRPN